MSATSNRGIRTVDDIKDRCIVDDFTGCWLWQSGMKTDRNGSRCPALWVFDSQQGKFRVMSGPQALLEITGKRAMLGVTTGWRTCRCAECMNPEHLAGGTKADWGRWMRSHGIWKNVPARIVANRKAARSRTETTAEMAQAVRDSSLSGLQAAAEFGLKPRHVSQIRNGERWANQVAPGASVFTLGAR